MRPAPRAPVRSGLDKAFETGSTRSLLFITSASFHVQLDSHPPLTPSPVLTREAAAQSTPPSRPRECASSTPFRLCLWEQVRLLTLTDSFGAVEADLSPIPALAHTPWSASSHAGTAHHRRDEAGAYLPNIIASITTGCETPCTELVTSVKGCVGLVGATDESIAACSCGSNVLSAVRESSSHFGRIHMMISVLWMAND